MGVREEIIMVVTAVSYAFMIAIERREERRQEVAERYRRAGKFFASERLRSPDGWTNQLEQRMRRLIDAEAAYRKCGYYPIRVEEFIRAADRRHEPGGLNVPVGSVIPVMHAHKYWQHHSRVSVFYSVPAEA